MIRRRRERTIAAVRLFQLMAWFSYIYKSLARDFVDDGPTLKAQLTPRHFGNVDENLKASGWDDVVASLKEHYTSEGSGSTHCITNCHRWATINVADSSCQDREAVSQ